MEKANISKTFREYPSENKLSTAREILKPPGIVSNNYNTSQLKKVDRAFVSSKDVRFNGASGKMYQTDYNPKEHDLDSSYFSITTKRHGMSTYDRIKHVQEGYNQKLHRDDREHAKSHGLRIHQEECERWVPARTNSTYGHTKLQPVDRLSNMHGHAEVCLQDFYRLNGANTNQS